MLWIIASPTLFVMLNTQPLTWMKQKMNNPQPLSPERSAGSGATKRESKGDKLQTSSLAGEHTLKFFADG